MDEILALQRELAAVQEEDTTYRLSERNCMEIIMKLVKLGLLDIIYTTNGKELITPQQLSLELQDELLSAGGRLALADAQPLLNVDISHIEKAAAGLVINDPELLLINGELIAAWHLDGVVEEVLSHTLPGAGGKVSVATLAAQMFNLPVPITEEAIKTRLLSKSNQLKAKLKHGVLFTAAYEETQLARIRGVLAGVTRPISTGELINIYGFDEGVMEEILPRLLKENVLVGSLRGREYVPLAFSRTQRECLEGFFAQNGFLEFERARKMQVYRPLEFIKQSFPDAFLVGKQLVVAASVLRELEGQVEGCILLRGWLDVLSVLPPVFSSSSSEAALLLAECRCVGPEREKGAVAIAGSYAVSKAFLHDALKEMESPTKARALEQQQQQGIKGDGGGVDEILDECGRKKGSKSQVGKSAAGAAAASFPTAEIAATILSWHPPLEAYPSLTTALARELQSEVNQLFSTHLAAAVAAAAAAQLAASMTVGGEGGGGGEATARRQAQRDFEKELESATMTIQLLAKGVKLTSFASEEDEREMTLFILKSRGAQLADLVSQQVSTLHDIPYTALPSIPPSSSSLPPSASFPCITLEQRNVFKRVLPKPLGDALVSVWTLIVKGKAKKKKDSDKKTHKKEAASATAAAGAAAAAAAAGAAAVGEAGAAGVGGVRGGGAADKSKASTTATAAPLDDLCESLLSQVLPALDAIPRKLDKKAEKKLVCCLRIHTEREVKG